MAKKRRLTIAAMRGTVWIRFRDVANHDTVFNSICGGFISVSRSQNGTTYMVKSDTDHIRVFVDLIGPTDLPNVFWWGGSDTYGWWHLEDFQQTDFPTGLGILSDGIEVTDISFQELGKPLESNLW